MGDLKPMELARGRITLEWKGKKIIKKEEV